METDQQHRESRQHDKTEVARNLAQHVLQRMPAEIAHADKQRRPHTGGDEIEDHEAAPVDATDAKRERREIAHAIDEPETEDEAGVVTLEPAERGIDLLAPHRLARQHAQGGAPAPPEITLVARQTVQP